MRDQAAERARWRLVIDRWRSRLSGVAERDRVLTTVCWSFPIYSQTFVYEELSQLVAAGFDVRLVYSELDDRAQLPAPFDALWARKRPSALDPARAASDIAHYMTRMPAAVEALLARLGDASGLDRDAVLANEHVRMAFSYTRLADAYRPAYLHSYFFYEGTLFTFVASQLLGIPRGVSCYADHMLDDFALKLVPMHLETCDIVVATSERIGAELAALHPHAHPSNILVKPNAIDTRRFPKVSRAPAAADEPVHAVCVSRIEPKKGLLDLMDALSLVRQRGINMEVHLVGAPDNTPEGAAYAASLTARIAALELTAVVHLHGRQSPESVRTLLERGHLFVAPFVETAMGDKDGIPTALLEAMSTGAAIVTTDAGSITEPIESGVNGLVVAQHRPDLLADALATLSTDAARRGALGDAAASTVRNRYDVTVCERRLHERIRHVVASRLRRSA